jgi:ribosomal protein S12 methylthiotransferase accessory factor
VELEPLPILFVATIADAPGAPPAAYVGFGCSLSPEHAAVRAITEAAQSRLFDISATREDLLRPGDPTPATGDRNRRRPFWPRGRWYFDAPGPRTRIERIADRSTSDVGHDLAAVIAALVKAQTTRIAFVDLSPCDSPIVVVRAVVPELETTFVDGRVRRTVAAARDPKAPPLITSTGHGKKRHE